MFCQIDRTQKNFKKVLKKYILEISNIGNCVV